MTCEDVAFHGFGTLLYTHTVHYMIVIHTYSTNITWPRISEVVSKCDNADNLKKRRAQMNIIFDRGWARGDKQQHRHCKQHTYILNTCVTISPYTNFVEGTQVWQNQWCMAQCITQFFLLFPLAKRELKKAVLKPSPIARLLADHRTIANFKTFAHLGTRLLLRAPSHPCVQIESRCRSMYICKSNLLRAFNCYLTLCWAYFRWTLSKFCAVLLARFSIWNSMESLRWISAIMMEISRLSIPCHWVTRCAKERSLLSQDHEEPKRKLCQHHGDRL